MMKNIAITIAAFCIPLLSIGQGAQAESLHFEVNKVHPYISITGENLKNAHTIGDLNRHFKPSWVREYLKVKVVTYQKGTKVVAESKSVTLNAEQKSLLVSADAASEISVRIEYIPENTLKQNDPKTFDFTFTPMPEQDASYPGGESNMMAYLEEQAIARIPSEAFTGFDLTAIKFTVSAKGEVIKAHFFDPIQQAKRNTEVEATLLKALEGMPAWTPAQYSDGLKVSQDFILTVGNMENCVVSLLNIRP